MGSLISVSVVAIALIALLMGLLLNKKVGFVILVAELPLMGSAIFGFHVTPTAFIVIVIFGIFMHVTVKRDTITVNRRYVPLLIFCAYIITHLIIWLYEEPTVSGLTLLVYYLSLPMLSILLASIIPHIYQNLGDHIAKWLAGGILVYWVIIIVVFAIAPESVSQTGEFGIRRLLGLGGTHPAYTTSFVPFALVLGLYFMTRTPRNILLGVSLLATMVVSVIATAARAGLVSAGITLILLPIYLKRLRLRVAFLCLVLVFVLYFFIRPLIIGDRMEYFMTLTSIFSAGTENRLFEYQAAKDLFFSHPLFGTGLREFRPLALPLMLYYADRIRPGYSLVVLELMDEAPFSINSTYLFYLVQTGVIGFCLFAYLVLYATRKLAEMRRGDSTLAWDFLFAGWLGFLAHLLVVQGFIHPLLWFIIALSLSLPSRTITQGVHGKVVAMNGVTLKAK